MPISIGIPFFNAESFLADAIRSVFAQTYQDWELILVDDGSTDRSLEIARSVKDPRVRIFSDGENRKLPYRLNQITAEARYGYIGRMDADDLCSLTRFEKQLAILDAHPEIDLVTTGVCSITNDSRPIGTRCPASGPVTIGDLLPMKGCVINHPAIVGRKAWFVRHPYDASLATAQDAELWVRACSRHDLKIYRLAEPLYYYREAGTVSMRKIICAGRVTRDIFRRYGHLKYSPFGVRLQILKSHCKSLAKMLSVITHQQRRLIDRRNRGCDAPEMRDCFVREIHHIRHMQVNGLD